MASFTRTCSRPKLQWRPLKPSGRTKGEDEAAACSNYAEMLDTRAAVGAVGTLKGRWYLRGAQKTQTRQELQGDAPDGRCSGARRCIQGAQEPSQLQPGPSTMDPSHAQDGCKAAKNAHGSAPEGSKKRARGAYEWRSERQERPRGLQETPSGRPGTEQKLPKVSLERLS